MKATAGVVAVAALSTCRTSSPTSPTTTAPTAGTSRADTVDFDDIQLPQAEVSITRESPSPVPNEILRLSVKVAHSADSRAQGLMRVKDLPPSAGMVFLYERPTNGGFYMKNTLIPLDIAFWGEDRKIHSILQMPPCRRDPCPTFAPQLPFVGALEVESGLLKEKGVQKGDTVRVWAQTTRS